MIRGALEDCSQFRARIIELLAAIEELGAFEAPIDAPSGDGAVEKRREKSIARFEVAPPYRLSFVGSSGVEVRAAEPVPDVGLRRQQPGCALEVADGRIGPSEHVRDFGESSMRMR